MHKFEIFGTYKKDPLRGREYTYPGSYEECTHEQLAQVALITSAADIDGDEGEAGARLRLLRILAGIPEKYFGPQGIQLEDLVGVRYDEFNVDRAAFLPSLDWAFTRPIWQKSIVPEVVVGDLVFKGPTDRLGKFSILQWILADSLLAAFQADRSEGSLHRFLAALYHPKGKRWNNATIERRAKDLARLDEKTKLAAVLNYQGLRGWVVKKYDRCFRGGESDPHGPIGMVVRLAGPKFGRPSEVQHENMHHVFVYVEQCMADAEELERQRK